MFTRKSIVVTAQDGVALHGWLYTPIAVSHPLPAIIMTHGFTALKEHHLAPFAEAFAGAGMCVLVYDNRHFGESGGEPRFEVNPLLQVADLQDAVTFMQNHPMVDPHRIGLWGTSLSGGNVIVAASRDKRVSSVVAQVPFVCGHHAYLKTHHPERWRTIQRKYHADQKARAAGKLPAMTPVVTQQPHQAVVMQQPEAYDFFTSVPSWQNQVTLASVASVGDYRPMDDIANLSPIPLLMIIATQDTVCITQQQLLAFDQALTPKKCVMIEGHHFSPFSTAFSVCVQAASEWFRKTLSMS